MRPDRLQQRGLSRAFMHDLTEGDALLEPIWRLVRADKTLSLCIREDYINLYYRGGNLICIRRAGSGKYTFEFNCNYIKGYGRRSDHLPRPDVDAIERAQVVTDPAGVSVWLGQVPLIKFSMDLFFAGRHGSEGGADQEAGPCGGVAHLEREHQQLVERANNSDRSTDYFILDMEYTNTCNTDLRLDMIALHWPARGRRRGRNQDLAIIEMKYGESAVSGKCGLYGHICALRDALDPDGGTLHVSALAREMARLTAQRIALQLFEWPGDGTPDCEALEQELIPAGTGQLEYIILLADYPPQSPRLAAELDSVMALGELPFGVKIATSNLMGYGLYDVGLFSLSGFRERYGI